MRLECESCRQLVVASLGIDGGTVRATCPKCQHVMTSRVVPAELASAAPRCPKCGAPRRGELAACASCGLAMSRMAAYTEARDAAVPSSVRDAWTRATERWSEIAAHDELLQLAATHNGYAWVAGRYRTRGQDPVAVRQLARLRRAAEATLFAGATARSDAASRPYRAARSVLAILILAIAVGLLYATVIRGNPRPTRMPAIPARPLAPGQPVSPSTIR